MFSKKNFIFFFECLKQMGLFIKSASIKTFFWRSYNKKSFLPIPKIKIINQIIKSYTRSVNKYFVILIIITCLVTITITYYEQKYKFKQQLLIKTEFAHSRIEKITTAYQESLILLGQVMLDEKKYLEPKQIIQLLKLTYISDENIKLLPVTWHSLLDFNKSFSAYGSVIEEQDTQLIDKLNAINNTTDANNKPQQFIFSDQPNEQGENTVIIIHPIIEQTDLTNNKKHSLIGYLKLQVKLLQVLQSLYDIFENDELLKISNQNQAIFFHKQDDSFRITKDLRLNEYQFASEVSIINDSYKIAVGKNNQQLIISVLQATSLRCGIILMIGSLMFLVYNYIERRKGKKLYNELFTEEISSLHQNMQDLAVKLTDYKKAIDILTKQNLSYKASAKVINAIEQQINTGYIIALNRIKNSNQSLIKHYSHEKELTTNEAEKAFLKIHETSMDLLNNVINRNIDPVEVNLEVIIDEVITIFSPIINAHSISIKKIISRKNDIKANELILKQILISIFAKLLRFLPKDSDSIIKISVHNDNAKNNVIIEITDNGFGFDVRTSNNIIEQTKNEVLPGIAHIQLHSELVEVLTREILAGQLNIKNFHKKGDLITLSIPVDGKFHNRGELDNIIDFPKLSMK
jgi:hypothetical protein